MKLEVNQVNVLNNNALYHVEVPLDDVEYQSVGNGNFFALPAIKNDGTRCAAVYDTGSEDFENPFMITEVQNVAEANYRKSDGRLSNMSAESIEGAVMSRYSKVHNLGLKDYSQVDADVRKQFDNGFELN